MESYELPLVLDYSNDVLLLLGHSGDPDFRPAMFQAEKAAATEFRDADGYDLVGACCALENRGVKAALGESLVENIPMETGGVQNI